MTIAIGMWMWDIAKCEGGNIDTIVARCRHVGLSHVLIKTNDGTEEFNGTLEPLVTRLHDAGVTVWAWQYSYGRAPAREAEAFATRALALAVNGLCVNAEQEYTGQFAAATTFMERLRALAPALPVAVASYPLPQQHRQFPWREFLGRADIAMPEVYWYGADPAQLLAASYEQYAAYLPRERLMPIGASFPEGTGDPANISKFIDGAEMLHVRTVSFWSWQHTTPAMWAQITTRHPPGAAT